MKKWTKGLLAGVFAGTMILTGCSSITQISNNENKIMYNGGSVVSVGDYLFYGNGFVSGVDSFNTSSDSEYIEAQKYSYLARTNISNFTSDKYSNDNTVNKISDKISGYSNIYMFVLGNYIYYATPNMHKTSANKYVWTYVSFYRCGLNGEGNKEIYTTSAYSADKAQIKALEYNGSNYLIIFDGTNLVKLKLGEKVSSTVISTGATSVALPDENESWNGNIYYTEARNSEIGQTGNSVYKVNVESTEGSRICQENGITISFTGRVGDTLFYSRNQSYPSITETYILDTTSQIGSFATAGKRFYSLEIFDVEAIAENNTQHIGYVFSTTISDKTKVMYYNKFDAEQSTSYTAEVLVGDGTYSDTVVIYGTDFYYTTSEGIMKASVLTNGYASQKIVSDMTIKSGYSGYDFVYVEGEISRLNNIYFYAQRVYDKDAEDYEESKATDTNYYLYSIDANGVKDPTLLGKTI